MLLYFRATLFLIFLYLFTIIFAAFGVPSSLQTDALLAPFRDTLDGTVRPTNNAIVPNPIRSSGNVSASGFFLYSSEVRSVLLVNGTADDSFIVTFILEEKNQPSNYTFAFSSNDTRILDASTDIASSQTETLSSINITIALDFHQFPGCVQIAVEARRILDGSLHTILRVDYIVAGIAIYIAETDTIISGAGRSFVIPSYEVVYQKPHWEFAVFVGYPNGSNSDNQVISYGGLSPPTTNLDSIAPELMFYNGQILWDDVSCAIDSGIWKNDQLLLKSGCGMGFGTAYTNGTIYDGFRFAVNFQPYRAGIFGVFFTWNGFTLESDLEYEELTNYVVIEILGQPPSVVRRIEPANPFNKEGGEELFVETINTADVNMISFNVNEVPFLLLPGSRTIVHGPDDFYETAKFITEPGTGKRLPWAISATRTVNGSETSVTFIDETGFLFSYDTKIVVLSSVLPSKVPEAGNVPVVLYGEFPKFNLNDSTHNVFFGNLPVQRLQFVSFNDSAITFMTPSRSRLGASWTYWVYVQVGDSFSNELAIEFSPSSLVTRGTVFGASYSDDAKAYVLNFCGETTFIVTTTDGGESNDLVYEWKLLDNSKVDYLALDNASAVITNTNLLKLPNSFIPRFHKLFYVVVYVSDRRVTGTHTFTVKKSNGHIIGVTLIQPENRTVAVPIVNVRIIAKIELPQCAEMPSELVYEWEFENKTQTLEMASQRGMTPLSVHEASLPPTFEKFVFSYMNDSGTHDNEITPTRLGRELIVPREFIDKGLHRIRLTVRGNDKTNLIGFDSTSLTIYESSLVAIIGAGQLSRRVSDVEPLVMSSQNSYDPDIIISSDKTAGLQYAWSCNFSLFSNFSGSMPCGKNLLPSQFVNISKFEIGPDVLQAVSKITIEGEQGNVYLRYQVSVSKKNRASSATQILSLTRTSGQMVSSYQLIEFVNSRNEVINPNAVEFWDEVVIRPIAPVSTEWRFRLELPISERSRFLTSSGNLIASPGYYTVSGRNAPGFQRLPLGIDANRLQPRQTYQFLITFQEAGRLADDVTIQLKTLEVPNLLFPPLAISNGSTSTIFRATASTSFDSRALFTYQFYLFDLSKNSSEYCIDGCTGAHTVRFQIPKVGVYMLQCRLLAANGKTLLSVKNNTNIITVFSSSADVSYFEYDTSIMRDFKLGDDGWVSQGGFFATESMYEQDEQVMALSNPTSDQACIYYSQKWVQILHHIVTNELPNTANARNYVIIAANFARLRCVADEDTLYKLLKIVDKSISKTPQEEVLTTSSSYQSSKLPNVELQEELRRFYNFTYTRASQIVLQGSSRLRLIPPPGVVNNLIIDVSELSMKHMTATATSGRVCGWEAKYTLDTWDGVPDRNLISSKLGSPLGITSVHVAVKCNAEQGRSMSTPHANFEWCDAVYAVSGDTRKLVTLVETFDYPYLSGVQGENASETVRVVMVDITTLGKGNQLESVVSTENIVTAQATGRGANAKTCYKVGMQLSSNPTSQTMSCWINQPFRMSPRKPFGWQLSEPFEHDMYRQRTTGLFTTPDTYNSSLNVTAQSNELGLYGAYRTVCDNNVIATDLNPMDETGVILAGILIGILLLIIIITALTYLLVSIMVGSTARDHDGAGVDEDYNYVERDYFGRREVCLNMGSYDSTSTASSFYKSQRSIMNATARRSARDRSFIGGIRQANDESMLRSDRAQRP